MQLPAVKVAFDSSENNGYCHDYLWYCANSLVWLNHGKHVLVSPKQTHKDADTPSTGSSDITCYANGVCGFEADFIHQMTALVESSDAISISKHDTNSNRQVTESVHSLDAELRTACLYELGKGCTFSECVVCSDLPDDSFLEEKHPRFLLMVVAVSWLCRAPTMLRYGYFQWKRGGLTYLILGCKQS